MELKTNVISAFSLVVMSVQHTKLIHPVCVAANLPTIQTELFLAGRRKVTIYSIFILDLKDLIDLFS